MTSFFDDCRSACAKLRSDNSGSQKEDLSARAVAGMNFVAIDFETANYRPDSACALGLVKVVDGIIVDKEVHLIKPPTREFVFTYIHGLTWKDVVKEADFGEIWPKVVPLFHGAEFRLIAEFCG